MDKYEWRDAGGCLQGDLAFLLIDEIPETAKKDSPEGDHYVMSRSSKGNHHIIPAGDAEVYSYSEHDFIGYMKIKNDTAIKHLRTNQGHDPIHFKAGDKVKIIGQREVMNGEYMRRAD